VAAVVTLGSLVTRARKLAKMENSTFAVDAEIRRILLSSWKRVRHRLQGHGQEYERVEKELDTIAGQSIYDLPADFYRLLLLLGNPSAVQVPSHSVSAEFETPPEPGVWNDPSSDAVGWRPLTPFEMREKVNLLNNRSGTVWMARYRLRGVQAGSEVAPKRQIEILPVPRAVYTLRLEYLPITTADDSADQQIETLDGFEDIAVYEAVVWLLQQEESDASWALGWLERKEAELDEVAPAQDVTHGDRIVNVYEEEGLHGMLPHQVPWWPSGVGP